MYNSIIVCCVTTNVNLHNVMIGYRRGLLLTHDNICSAATFIHPSANTESRIIHFGPGEETKKILEVSLGYFGTQNPTIVITVGLESSHHNKFVDSDLHVGISDGTNSQHL